VLIVNSTIADISTSQGVGGAIVNDRGTVVVTNTTFSGNKSGIQFGAQIDDTSAGDIFNIDGTITLTNVTIAHNGARSMGDPPGRGGGLHNASGRITLHNSILAHNQADIGPDCFGTVTSPGYKIVGNVTGCTFLRRPNDSFGDPRIGDFVASTIPGRGHFPLEPGSAAIDRGLSPTCGAVDQLNQPRRDGDGSSGTQCDRGAVEFQP
jgi:hypothetical protein